jgi:hypothetical protein
MPKPAWTPWHKVLTLRDDLRSGDLPLSMFAADLYDVAMERARPVYQDPGTFFGQTYPTWNIRELARDVALRLAGRNDKAVRQLQLTYGGGKTHTLITLLHLFNAPERLPELRAVDDFRQHIAISLPPARVVVLPFDKLDVEKGMEVRSPAGDRRWLRHPWSVLAWQAAGADGLRLLHAEGLDQERQSAPAENLLVDLLAMPVRDGLSTLVLIDEVLMFAREKIGLDPAWRARLVDFFQYLTQAATKVDRCAIVASLLATDPHKSDTLGKEITQELYAIFRRQQEEGVQPVQKDDVAEILRRRFFTTESIKDREAFRPHVVAALKGIGDLDEQTKKEGKAAEDRFLASFPFHPDLTDVFYSKWTSLEAFQRTRGVLRTYALALRDAEPWDAAPLVGLNVFLSAPSRPGLSEAARELAAVATSEEYDGKTQQWAGILEGEMQKARAVQDEFPALRNREVEQAVVGTFLHSQPIGHKALTRDLFGLLGQTRPDKIELEKGLKRWAGISWFLDEAGLTDADAASNGEKALPKSWRLGSRPNLRQMHDAAWDRVSDDLVSARLIDEIGKLKSLTAGASAAGARVHNLPAKPRDIEDDGEFHYAVLAPKCASDSGKPSPEARRFLEETTGPDRPRVYRNAVVLVAPSRDGLENARSRVRDYLAWAEVPSELKRQLGEQAVDPIREGTLAASISISRSKIAESIAQAYSVVVTVSRTNEIAAFKIGVDPGEPLFNQIKGDSERARIQETAVTAEALLPGGPYNLWQGGETARRVKDLAGAFAQFAQLPKMLNRRAIIDTLVQGCKDGLFVLRSTRADRSTRTFWRVEPDQADVKDPSLEVVLPGAAVLSDLAPALLLPGALPELWTAPLKRLADFLAYFEGGRGVKVLRNGYEEPFVIPKAERSVVEEAIRAFVREGRLWLTSGPASILGEEIPGGLLTDEAVLQAPPPPIAAASVTPDGLPQAWSGNETTALAIAAALANREGRVLPWAVVREALDGAFRAGLLQRTLDSAPWPCDYAGAQAVKVKRPETQPGKETRPKQVKPGVQVAEAALTIGAIQDLAEKIAELAKQSVGAELRFVLRVELAGAAKLNAEALQRIAELLKEVSPDLTLGDYLSVSE